MSKYTMKLYKNRQLIAEQTWDTTINPAEDIPDDAHAMIEEAVECNEPADGDDE